MTAPVRVAVEFDWVGTAAIGLGDTGALDFGSQPAVPTVYRIVWHPARDGDRTRVYVGETANLQRRLAGYRNPGPSQETNRRIHELLVEHLRAGFSAEFSAAATVGLQLDGAATPADLADRWVRLLAENATLFALHVMGVVEVVNAP